LGEDLLVVPAGDRAMEVVNFPLNVCGGIVRGTARPSLGLYLIALPVGVALGFRAGLGLEGLLAGFLLGVLVVVILRMDWVAEAHKAASQHHLPHLTGQI
jgi:multidrug resistance protein, MATE family